MSHASTHLTASERGFSLTELLVSLTLTLTVLAGAYSAMREAGDATRQAATTSDLNQNLRVAMNIFIRDLSQAGEGDYGLRTGISIPSGNGVDPIVRPGPAGAAWTFAANYTALPAISPANGIGIVVNGVATDVVTMLMEDRRLDLSGVIPNIPASGASLTFPNGFAIDDPVIGIEEGDLIRFGNGAMQEVTNVAGNTVHFHANAASRLNQRTAPQGSVMALKGEEPTFPDLPVSRVRMVTYYLRLGADGTPQLVRRVNYGAERVIAIGIENLQLSWDLVDGANNPTNVEIFADEAEGQIRKANVYMSAQSRQFGADSTPMRTALTTQISLRSMAFVSRYDIAP
jgi:prepilin-type N-terminal cleavage/methylation domain-containing protein